MLKTHVALTLAKNTGDGDVFLSGETSGWAATMIELTVRHAHGHPVMLWQSYDEIDGLRHGSVIGLTGGFEEENFAVTRGVHGGRNDVAIRVERYGHVRLTSVVALADTGVQVRTVGPPRVALTFTGKDAEIYPGRAFEVQYGATLVSGAPAKQVIIYPTFDPRRLAPDPVQAHPAAEYRILRGTKTGRFVFRALAPGVTRIRLSMRSSADNQPEAELLVRVDRKPARGKGGRTKLAVAIGVLALASLSFWRKARRRGSRAGEGS